MRVVGSENALCAYPIDDNNLETGRTLMGTLCSSIRMGNNAHNESLAQMTAETRFIP